MRLFYSISYGNLLSLSCSIAINLLTIFRLHGQETGLDDGKKLSQYVLRGWSTEEGMASESTNEIMQSDDGYIWIATYAGLHRFDGREFTIFNSYNSEIPSQNVLRLEEGLQGEIWIGTHHGIAIYQGGRFDQPDALKATRDMSIEQMLVTSNGDLWFSTRTNDLFRLRENELKDFTREFNVKESTVLAIVESQSGEIYFGTDDSRLFSYSLDEEFNVIPLEDHVNGVNTILPKDDLIYIGTGRGLYIWDAEELSKFEEISDKAIRDILVDDQEVIWLGTMNGLFRWDAGKQSLDSLTEDSGMPNNIVRDMLFDDQGNLWVATYRKGIFFLSAGTITSFTEDDGLETNIISGIIEIEENTYLLGNENGILNQLKGNEISIWKPPISLPAARLKHMFHDSRGRIWVSTYGGLFVLDGTKSRKYTIEDGFPDNYLRVANEDHEGTIWVGTKNAGLIRFKTPDDWEQLTIEDGLSSNYIMSIEIDRKGRVIVGTIAGLNIIDQQGGIKTITVEDGLPSNFMFSTFTTSNFIWIASNDGLTGYSEDQVVNFNSENGLEADIIYNILSDEQGNLWMPSENSILSIDLDQLESGASDPAGVLRVKQYDKSYGMKSTNFLGAVHSFMDSKGVFWMPTLGGVVRLDPREVNDPYFNPKMIIEDIVADNKRLDISHGDVSVPARTDRLLFDFTAISYVQTDRLQFRYKLDPFDKEWINASPERNAIYTNLPPRTYTFHLQTGIDGVFTSDSLDREVTIEAKWWQTVWSRVLMIVLVIALALLIYWLRLRALTANNIRLEKTVSKRTEQLEGQKQELKEAIEQLKSAQEQMVQSDKMASLGILSAGVAHEINNPLNFIQGGVEGLEHSLKKHNELEGKGYSELIDAIKEGISRASKIVASLNEFSHSADERDEPCHIHHMINNCLTMIQYRLKEGIKVRKEFSDQEVLVMGNNGKIHQAFLNIVTNAMQAIEDQGEITIKTWVDEDYVIIEFKDTGHGIKPDDLSKITEPFFSTKDPGKGTGLGLSITYSIIADHNGQLSYSSIWGSGTTAKVTLPLMQKESETKTPE